MPQWGSGEGGEWIHNLGVCPDGELNLWPFYTGLGFFFKTETFNSKAFWSILVMWYIHMYLYVYIPLERVTLCNQVILGPLIKLQNRASLNFRAEFLLEHF